MRQCKDDPKNDDYDPEDHEAFRMDYIPLDYKVRVLALVEAHPTWSLETLRKSGARRLKRKEYLAQWEKDVQTGGTRYDKLHKIDIDTFERFKKARASGQHVKFINPLIDSFNNDYVYTFCIHLNDLK